MTDIDAIDERAQVLMEQLSVRLNTAYDDDTAVDLALIQLMPFEEDKKPLKLVDAVLEHNPRHGLANLERAYLTLHYLMDDDNLTKSARNLEIQLDDHIYIGASALQLGELRRALDIKSTFSDTKVLIQIAVDAEPGWTLNHLQQARVLREEGRLNDARAAYNRAIDNLIDNELETAQLDWSFAACFTGQLLPRRYLEKERDELG